MSYSYWSSSWAPSGHTWTPHLCLCSQIQSPQYRAQSSTVLRIEGSTERLMRPVKSTIGLFESHVLVVRELVKAFAHGAVSSHTFRENWSHKTRIVRGVNSCERVALSSGVVCQSQEKKRPSTGPTLLQWLPLHHRGGKGCGGLLCTFQQYMHDTNGAKENSVDVCDSTVSHLDNSIVELVALLSSTTAAAEWPATSLFLWVTSLVRSLKMDFLHPSSPSFELNIYKMWVSISSQNHLSIMTSKFTFHWEICDLLLSSYQNFQHEVGLRHCVLLHGAVVIFGPLTDLPISVFKKRV